MDNNLKTLISFLKRHNFFNKIQTIVEIGARDCAETLDFNTLFPQAYIYAFECNPDTLPLCRSRVKDNKRIFLIEKAVVESDTEGEVTFFQIDKEATRTTWIDGNPGASSLFKASGKYPIETYVQRPITVSCISLAHFVADYNINKIDLLWMDIQGAELLALRGAGDFIKNIGIIHLEVEFLDIYENQPLFNDVKAFLNKHGFQAVDFTSFNTYSADCIFVNNQILPSLFKKTLFKYRNYFIHDFLTWRTKRIKLAQLYHKIENRNERFKFVLRRKSIEIAFLPSKTPIDILIPCTEKHLITLPHVINSLRQNVLHPINKIILVIDINSVLLINKCRELNVEYRDEQTCLPIKKEDINYNPLGINRSNWIFQQLLKLNANVICDSDFILICDADLILVHPQSFLTKTNKHLFRCSDEYHAPYTSFKTLLNTSKRFASSFVSHHIVFDKKRLMEMKQHIEKVNKKMWYQAILDNLDPKEVSSFSEYETYGNFIASFYPKELSVIYWHHKALIDEELTAIADLGKQNKYLSVGFPFIK
jgi:FkbM family methyltransferase